MSGLNSESVEIVLFFFFFSFAFSETKIQPLNSKTPKKLSTNSLTL